MVMRKKFPITKLRIQICKSNLEMDLTVSVPPFSNIETVRKDKGLR